jgi:L-cysteine S-thiosulfotransferase
MANRLAAFAMWHAAAFAPAALAQAAPGLEIFVRPDKGHCIACHQVPPGAGPETKSNLGPRLEGSRMRQLGRAALRELIHDPTRANASTVMTPYGRHRVLDAAEIDRVVDYLHALP